MLAQRTTRAQAWHYQGHLQRVEQHIVVRHFAKAMPLRPRLQQPVLRGQAVDAFGARRLPDAEPPVVGGDVLAQVGQGTAKAQRLVEHFLQQRTPGRPFHHGRGHVQ
ncbi:hypothetical protein D3C76_1137700 [compost metagenome]